MPENKYVYLVQYKLEFYDEENSEWYNDEDKFGKTLVCQDAVSIIDTFQVLFNEQEGILGLPENPEKFLPDTLYMQFVRYQQNNIPLIFSRVHKDWNRRYLYKLSKQSVFKS